MFGANLFDCIRCADSGNSCTFETDNKYGIAWLNYRGVYVKAGDVVNSEEILYKAF